MQDTKEHVEFYCTASDIGIADYKQINFNNKPVVFNTCHSSYYLSRHVAKKN